MLGSRGAQLKKVDLMYAMHFDAFANPYLSLMLVFLILELILLLHLQQFCLLIFYLLWNCHG